MNHPHIYVLSLLIIIVLSTLVAATDPPKPVIIHRPQKWVGTLDSRMKAEKYRAAQQEIYRNLIHFYLVHEQCECRTIPVIPNQMKLLKIDEMYVDSENAYLLKQQQRLPLVMGETLRTIKPRETHPQDRKWGFFDAYYSVLGDCSHTPEMVEVYPAIKLNPTGGTDSLIWSLYIQIEALWEAAETHRAVLNALWPESPRDTERGIENQGASRTARRRRPYPNHQMLPELNLTPSPQTQTSTEKDPHTSPRSDELSKGYSESSEIDNTRLSSEIQAGTPNDPSQSMIHHQIRRSIPHAAPEFDQQSESRVGKWHSSPDLQDETQRSEPDRDTVHQVHPSSMVLPPFDELFGEYAKQNNEKTMRQYERPYETQHGTTNPIYRAGLSRPSIQYESNHELPHCRFPGPLQVCQPFARPCMRPHASGSMRHEVHNSDSDHDKDRNTYGTESSPSFQSFLGVNAGYEDKQRMEAALGMISLAEAT